MINSLTVSEYEKLKADTAADRKLVNNSFPCSIARRIDKLITYYELNEAEPIMIYTAMYHIGVCDGKRAERQRRKECAR